MNIYVGNLVFDVSEEDLKEAFEPFGEITEVRLIMDKLAASLRDSALSKCRLKRKRKRPSKR